MGEGRQQRQTRVVDHHARIACYPGFKKKNVRQPQDNAETQRLFILMRSLWTLMPEIKNMPLFGIGTYLLEGEDCLKVVEAGLKKGLTLIDTAFMYQNEALVGDAIKSAGVSRDDLYIISKVDVARHSYEGVLSCLRESLTKLGVDHLDLFLIHNPRTGNIVETWKGLIEAKRLGLATEIGVSNFGTHHIQQLLDAGLECPAYNEFEVHVWNQRLRQRAAMASLGIKVIGYCPLARTQMFGKCPIVAKVAADAGITESEVALRWSVTSGLITIPKTSKVSRIEEYAAVFYPNGPTGPVGGLLTDAQMELLKGADAAHFAAHATKAMWEPVPEQTAEQAAAIPQD